MELSGETPNGLSASVSLPKILTTCQQKNIGCRPILRRVRISFDSSSKNAVSLSFACTMKRWPSPRCASAIQIVRPRESIAETQPKLQPALGIVDHLLRRFACLKLCAHSLKASSESFNLFLLLRDGRLEFFR